MEVSIFNSLGVCKAWQPYRSARSIELALDGLAGEIYFVHARMGKQAAVARLVVR